MHFVHMEVDVRLIKDWVSSIIFCSSQVINQLDSYGLSHQISQLVLYVNLCISLMVVANLSEENKWIFIYVEWHVVMNRRLPLFVYALCTEHEWNIMNVI